jgi:hypothetical protein
MGKIHSSFPGTHLFSLDAWLEGAISVPEKPGIRPIGGVSVAWISSVGVAKITWDGYLMVITDTMMNSAVTMIPVRINPEILEFNFLRAFSLSKPNMDVFNSCQPTITPRIKKIAAIAARR